MGVIDHDTIRELKDRFHTKIPEAGRERIKAAL
jgi:hypothetical protein